MSVPYSVKAGNYYVDETQTYGAVELSAEEAASHPEYMCESGGISWNLKIDKKTAFNVGYGAGSVFRKMQLFEMFWHAEGMKTAYSGEVMWNGAKYIVAPDTCYGYADKNWGRNFTSLWVWLSSNNFTSKLTGEKLTDSVFDIGGGCPKIGPVVLKRKLLSAYWYEGKEYKFNFSKFWTFTRAKFTCRETNTQIIWHIEQKTWRNRMVTDITCDKKDNSHKEKRSKKGANRPEGYPNAFGQKMWGKHQQQANHQRRQCYQYRCQRIVFPAVLSKESASKNSNTGPAKKKNNL